MKDFFIKDNSSFRTGSNIPDSEKIQMSFDIDDFMKPQTYKGNMAIAIAIRNLLLTKPGTYPDFPDMGLNIQALRFELVKDGTLEELRTSVSEAIKQYIPTVKLHRVLVNLYEDRHTGMHVLGFGFSIFTNEEEAMLSIFFQSDMTDNKNLKSYISI